MAHFAKSHRVLALDLPGFGESGRPGFPLTLDFYVEMLAHLISDLDLDSPILMGNCIGGAISLEFARTHPGVAHALILSNVCGGAAMMRYNFPFMFRKNGTAFSDRYYRTLFLPSGLHFVHIKATEQLYGQRPDRRDPIFRRLVEHLRHPRQMQSRMMMIHGLHTFNKFDHYQDDVSALPPVLMFWGQRNRVLPLARGKALMEQVKPEVAHIYLGKGHLLMTEAPEQFNRDVAAFLENCQTNQVAAPKP